MTIQVEYIKTNAIAVWVRRPLAAFSSEGQLENMRLQHWLDYHINRLPMRERSDEEREAMRGQY